MTPARIDETIREGGSKTMQFDQLYPETLPGTAFLDKTLFFTCKTPY